MMKEACKNMFSNARTKELLIHAAKNFFYTCINIIRVWHKADKV